MPEDILTFSFVDSPGPASPGKKAPPWRYKTKDGTQFKSWNAMGVAAHLPYLVQWEEKTNKLGGSELWLLKATPHKEALPGYQKANGAAALVKGNGEWSPEAKESAFVTSVMSSAYHSMAGKITSISVAKDIAALRDGYRASNCPAEALKPIEPEFNDSLEDTF